MRLGDYLDEVTGGGHYFIDEMLVLGPYPTRAFFDEIGAGQGRLHKHAPRSKLTVLADDGWDFNQVEEIACTFEGIDSRRRPEVITGWVSTPNGRGLVHAKVIFLVCKNKAGTYTKQTLVLGSANASIQGFGSHAETYISIDLADLDSPTRKRVLYYIRALQAGEPTEVTHIKLGRASWVTLPAVVRANSRLKSGFDAWLRQGRLCHKYEPDPSFGRLPLSLLHALPPRSLEGPFISSGFKQSSDPKQFARDYIALDAVAKGGAKTTWRDKFFIETYYGFWTSQNCYATCKSEFVASRQAAREEAIDTIDKADNAEHKQWLCAHLGALEEIVHGLREADPKVDIGIYFKTHGVAPNLAYYKERAAHKLRSDQTRARDTGFSARYINGYAFERVPQMGDEFENFALDWCQSVLSKSRRLKGKNKLVSVLTDATKDFLSDSETTPEEYLACLRENWLGVREALLSFYMQ